MGHNDTILYMNKEKTEKEVSVCLGIKGLVKRPERYVRKMRLSSQEREESRRNSTSNKGLNPMSMSISYRYTVSNF
jgi:hypothetical protein